METILDALQEGRLFELPENDKTAALQFLAHVLEACPEVPAETDIVGLVQKREQEANTALGKGWACPHARVPYQGDLLCVIGWSPQGIDYGAPDSLPVRLLVMYVIPDDQRSRYLREISLLVRAIQSYPEQNKLSEIHDLDAMRNHLLDLIEVSKALPGTDARARMIRLQARATPPATVIHDLSNLVVEPATIATGPDKKVVVLTQSNELYHLLASGNDMAEKLEKDGLYQRGEWRILRRAAVSYQGGWVSYDCIAVRLLPNTQAAANK